MLLGKHYLFLFPSKTHKKFPSQLDKIWLVSQPADQIYFPARNSPRFQIPRSETTEQKRQNRDKTGFFRKRNHSDQPSYVCDYSLGEGRGSFFFFFFSRPQSSEFLQPARVEMLEKVRPGKTSINNKISQPAHRNTCIFASQPARFLWGTDNARNRFVGCP